MYPGSSVNSLLGPRNNALSSICFCLLGGAYKKGNDGEYQNTRLALRLLGRFDEHISARLLLLHSNWGRGCTPYFSWAGGPKGFTGLHGVAFLGVAGMVSAVLEMQEWDVNAGDCRGITALAWASGRGHEEVVKILLEREEVDPNQADTACGQTPLLRAVEEGHEGIVKMLLE